MSDQTKPEPAEEQVVDSAQAMLAKRIVNKDGDVVADLQAGEEGK